MKLTVVFILCLILTASPVISLFALQLLYNIPIEDINNIGVFLQGAATVTLLLFASIGGIIGYLEYRTRQAESKADSQRNSDLDVIKLRSMMIDSLKSKIELKTSNINSDSDMSNLNTALILQIELIQGIISKRTQLTNSENEAIEQQFLNNIASLKDSKIQKSRKNQNSK